MSGGADPPGGRFAAWLRGLLTPRAAPAESPPQPAPAPPPAAPPAPMTAREAMSDPAVLRAIWMGHRAAFRGWPMLSRVVDAAHATPHVTYPQAFLAAIASTVEGLSLPDRAILLGELARREQARPRRGDRPAEEREACKALLHHLPEVTPEVAETFFRLLVSSLGWNYGRKGQRPLGFGRLLRAMEASGGFAGHQPLIEAWNLMRGRYPKLRDGELAEAELIARVENLLGIAPEPEPEPEPAPPESPFVVFDGLGSAEDAARVWAFAEAHHGLRLIRDGGAPRPVPPEMRGPFGWMAQVAIAYEERRTGKPFVLPPADPPWDHAANRLRRQAVAELLRRTPVAALVLPGETSWLLEADGIFAAAVARHGEITLCSPPALAHYSEKFRVTDLDPIPPDHGSPGMFIHFARGRRAAERLCGIRFRDWNTGEVQELGALRAADPELEELLWRARSAEPTRIWLREAEALCAGPTGAACRDAVQYWLDLAADGSAGLPSPGDYRLALKYRHVERLALAFLDTFGGPREAAIMARTTGVEAGLDTGYDWIGGYARESPALLSDANDVMLRGAVWFAAFDPAEVPRLLRVALAMLEKVPARGGVNYRSLIGINACIGALGRIATPEAVVALGRIRRRIRDERLAKTIAKAMATAAAKAGSTIEDLEELSVPGLGLEPGPDAACTIPLADGATATLSILGSAQTSVTLRRADGRVAKSVPAAVAKDEDSTAALKELRAAAKEVAGILPVQRLRLERSWLSGRRWTGRAFRDRYLSHPLLGWLAARLIWTITPAEGPPFSAIFRDGATPADAEGRARALADEDLVALWHPLAPVEPGAVGAWRAALLREEIVQPIRQAFRETYPLTDAERETATYSNRFAAHILRQSQANALARLRGWVCRTRMSADVPNDEPTHIRLPALGLAAEFWTKPDGEGDDMTEGGAYLYLGTDRVVFRPLRDEGDWQRDGGARLFVGAGMVPLEQVPAIAFSEVMRDVDLMVGVASIGRDEGWADAGAGAAHPNQWLRGPALDYWNRFSRAELEESGRIRRAVLEAMLPKLAIAERCRIEDRYLHVTGKVRRYRIHLGSGHVFLEPEDRYVCIVPARDPAAGIRLPFEGDAVLSLILSKAFLLAADDRIKDHGILSQIG